MTYSIVARCDKTGEMGVAIQSHWFNVGRETIWGKAGVGVVATQSFVDPRYGERGIEAMSKGGKASDVLAALLRSDEGREGRQVAMLCASGAPVVHTGTDCIPYAEHMASEHVACQANLMMNAGVPQAMLNAYCKSSGRLAERMIEAMMAAETLGGDFRGRQSAAILIVSGLEHDTWAAGVRMNLRVEDSQDPIGELARLVKLRRAYDLLNDSNHAFDMGEVATARRLHEEMVALNTGEQELIFWSKVSTPDELYKLSEKWHLLKRRTSGMG